jgi:hypothetical protein
MSDNIEIYTYSGCYNHLLGTCFYPVNSDTCTLTHDYYISYKHDSNICCYVCNSTDYDNLVNVYNELSLVYRMNEIIRSYRYRSVVCKEGECETKYYRIIDFILHGHTIHIARKKRYRFNRRLPLDNFLYSIRNLFSENR